MAYELVTWTLPSLHEAYNTLRRLNPVKFVYKTDQTERHAEFIAEEVPELIATKDLKRVCTMNVVAVFTKVVQDQQGLIQNQQKIVEQQQKIIAFHSKKITELERALKSKGNLGDGVEQTRIKVIQLISL